MPKKRKRIRLSFIGGRRPSILPPPVIYNRKHSDEKENCESKSSAILDKPVHIESPNRTPSAITNIEILPYRQVPGLKVSVISRSPCNKKETNDTIAEVEKKVNLTTKSKAEICPKNIEVNDNFMKEILDGIKIEKGKFEKLKQERKEFIENVKDNLIQWDVKKKELLNTETITESQLDSDEFPLDVNKVVSDIVEVCEQIKLEEFQLERKLRVCARLKEKLSVQMFNQQKEVNTTIFEFNSQISDDTPKRIIRKFLDC